jgi:glycosyltransferase A (GT-A) superfamily protein (DUF2064 family)
MRDLVIVSKFPAAGVSKTRLGRDIGFEESAKLAKFMLEDMVSTASQVCNVTISAHYSSVQNFRETYPDWNVIDYGKSNLNALLRWAETVRRMYEKNDPKKVVAVVSDIVVKKSEIEKWFKELDKHNLLIGPVYLGGLDADFGREFTSQLSGNPNLGNFMYACLRGILKQPKTKVLPKKTDVDRLSDVVELLDSGIVPPGRTKEYMKQLVCRYSPAYSC